MGPNLVLSGSEEWTPLRAFSRKAHRIAAEKLQKKLGWDGTVVVARSRKGYVFVFLPEPYASAVETIAVLRNALQLALVRAQSELRMLPLKKHGTVEHQSLLTAATKYGEALAKAEGKR